MTWRIASTTDPSRWLESEQGIEFTADPETAVALGDLSAHLIPVHPGGPMKAGVTNDGELLTAVWRVIPDPEVTGEYPQGKTYPTLDGLLVY